MTIICMWSGPRNLSTAIMRSFGARADTAVIDEPFFAPFLAVSGKHHPGRTETLARHETDPDRVAALCMAQPSKGAAHSFQKHMPHHMLDGFPLEWAQQARHFFLLRHPQRVIASYVKGRAAFDLDDLGFAPQWRLFEKLTVLTGSTPPVINSEDILSAPKQALLQLCAVLDIPFDPAMLSWAAGSRPEDGAWAPYWYRSVENSTGFGPPTGDLPHLGTEYDSILQQCLLDYRRLQRRAIQVKTA